MRILGIDPSLTSTGAVLLDDGELVWAERWATKLTGIDRLGFFAGLMAQAVMQGPQLVVIEGYSYGSPNGMAALAELGGVLRLGAYNAARPVEVIPPSTWRKELLGKGNLAKDQIRLAVWKRYHVEFDSNDVLEAWCVAMTAHRRRTAPVDTAPRPEPIVRRRKAVAL